MHSAVNLFKPEIVPINVLNINEQELQEQQRLSDIVKDFFDGVAEIRLLIKTIKAIIHCPVSQGKDSTIVELMAMEAYRQAREAGEIAENHPLILSTVDTAGEAIPMKMYVRYARKRILAYAKQHGINMIYDIVTPPVYDEYFVRFSGAQKLIPNATRNGDCSVILKITPSERYVKRVLGDLSSTYSNSPVVSCVGSRLDESGRRASNMQRQGIASKNVAKLLSEMGKESFGGTTIYKFAPIKNWSTDSVFDALRIAGSRPLLRRKGFESIPAFLSDFGLLLEIYGNGSNETCEISVGSNASSGCNGKARFGCVFCTMVAVKDNSSTALAALPRWRVLGAENTLRVRDYLFRLSIDMDARALHARAYDPVVFNRVALQPNILKPRYLEKMIRYAGQLTLDSRIAANEFKYLVSQGREMEHEGYRDIAEDPFMPPKTKKAFLEMYKECAQDPECLNVLFSDKHAIVLSFRWAIDGIGAAPYRPLAIWEGLKKNKGWIPYPLLNTEYEARYGALSLNNNSELPEAVMMPVYEYEDMENYPLNPSPLLDLWTRPNDLSDLFDAEQNCSLSTSAKHNAQLELTWQPFVSMSKTGEVVFESTILSARLNGKLLPELTHGILSKLGEIERFKETVSKEWKLLMTKNRDVSPEQLDASINAWMAEFNSKPLRARFDLANFEQVTLFTGFSEQARKQAPAINFTRRVTKVRRNQIERGNTRMVFYSHQPDSRLYLAHKQEVSLFVPNFQVVRQKFVAVHNGEQDAFNEDALQSIFVDEQAYLNWLESGGMARALSIHDAKLRERRGNRSAMRYYGGTIPAEQLMANGVISVDMGYYSNLLNIIRRTQVFDMIGFFGLQNKSAKEVLSHPCAIPMAKHRQDKYAVLKKIQAHRRKQRKLVRESSNEIHLKQSLDFWLDVAKHSVYKMAGEQVTHSCRLRFHTGDVSPRKSANVAALWLAMNLSEIHDAGDLLGKLLTAKQLSALKSDGAKYLEISQWFTRELSALADFIESTRRTWAPVLHLLETWSPSEGQSRDDAKAELKSRILALVPQDMVGDDMWVFWRPNLSVMQDLIAIESRRLNEHFDLLETLGKRIRSFTKVATRKAVARMSLSDKLALLA